VDEDVDTTDRSHQEDELSHALDGLSDEQFAAVVDLAYTLTGASRIDWDEEVVLA
jgi:hypothetical protein